MTLIEYLYQADPQKLPVGIVVLREGEFDRGMTSLDGSEYRTAIYIKAFPGIEYKVCKSITGYTNRVLYSTDEHGNPRGMSVFSLEENFLL